MKIRKIICLSAVVAAMASCAVPKDIVYIQDAPRDEKVAIAERFVDKIQIDDLLGISVSSTVLGANTASFNKGNSETAGGTSAQGYLVDRNGEINFPYIGRLKVRGMTREQLRDTLEVLLAKEELVPEPRVTVNLQNFKFYTLGATGKMNMQNANQNNMQGERLTLLQAIAMCGDLDISGQRKNVTIIREMDGYREIGTVDLTSKDVFDSPYYYVAQNDIIYVEPNDKMKRQANLDFTPLTVITSVLSFATSILTFVYIFLK
ncbi:MAG: polysaccharide biosynthesis/export family protein [Bacteroidales bacterium]|nr:polysaccharide biosynthesis/export family protein [Bacteroidales bacterium]